MLEVYKNVLTEKGAALHAKNLAGQKIEFTRFRLGNGVYNGSESADSLRKMLNLRSGKDYFGITKCEVVNTATCKLTMIATNLNITQGYYVTEIGVFAKGADGVEVLYSILVTKPDKPDWMPAYNGAATGSLKYYNYISVGDADNVRIDISVGGVASEEDMVALEGRVLALEQGAAACVGVRRRCAEDGTPISQTEWERFGQTVGKTAVYARGDEAVVDELMDMWPFNRIRPCNLAMDGSVVAYLGDPLFDWTATSDVTAGTSVMDEIPTEMYFAKWQDTDAEGQKWEYRVFSDSPRYPNSVYLKDLFQRADGSRTEAFYFPIFLGTKNAAGNYVSVPGDVPQYDTPCTTYRTQVKTNGANWQLIDKWAWDIFANLCLCYSADNNFRKTFGRGHCDWYVKYTSLAEATGTNTITVPAAAGTKLFAGNTVCVSSGADWGYDVAKNRTIVSVEPSEAVGGAYDVTLDGEAFATTLSTLIYRSAPRIGETVTMQAANGTAGPNDGQHAVRTLWVEDFFGTMHTGLDGMNLKFNAEKGGLEVYIQKDPSKYADNYTDYELLDEVIPLNMSIADPYDNSGYIKKEALIKNHPTLDIPVAVGGGAGSESYMASYRWANKNGQRPFAGGCFTGGSSVGPFSLNCVSAFSVASRYYASRPLKR